MNNYSKPLPLVSDPDHAPFWEGTKRRELLIRKCNGCGKYQWPPGTMCSHCHSFDLDWVKASGKGIVYTYTVTYRAFDPSFAGDVPYAVVVVELQEGPRMIGNSTHIRPEHLKIGMPMEAVFMDVTEGVTLVNWRPLVTEREEMP